MKIACLQFAPQVGDVDNNLHRADSVLAKADFNDLEDLDLIVLPELAFTGYNFKSLNEITPFLEPQGSGISALWARTTALKYDTNVIVGYPERVDVSARWPTGPEYYNSAIVVNGEGDTVANYRKSFLYAIDETWALEGEHGFFAGDIPGLGSTAMGICMDLNPYRFEAPWRAFEFAYHIQAVEANLVIVTMAWLAREDDLHFIRVPEEPDTETLTYWVRRLEPLIRSEEEDEVIVVFCNRSGMEDDLVYAGTSSVVGIKDGEVKIYGILGVGVEEVLMVDTQQGPFAKLVQRPEGEEDIASQAYRMSHRPSTSVAAKSPISGCPTEPSLTVNVHSGQRKSTPTSEGSLKPCKTRRASPRIRIPKNAYKYRAASSGTLIEESPGVATPTFPNPMPISHMPLVDLPKTKPAAEHADTQHQHTASPEFSSGMNSGRVSVEPPNLCAASPSSGHLSEKYFWSESQAPLKSPMIFRFPDIYRQEILGAETPVPSSLVKIHHEDHNTKTVLNSSMGYSTQSEELIRAVHSERLADSTDDVTPMKSNDSTTQDMTPPRPYSPKSRNASRTGRPLIRRHSEVEQPDLTGRAERLDLMIGRPASATESSQYAAQEPRQGRSRARRTSITPMDQLVRVPRHLDPALNNASPRTNPTIASPRVFSGSRAQTRSSGFKDSHRSTSRPTTGNGTTRRCPRAGARSSNRSVSGHSVSRTASRSGSTTNLCARGKSDLHIEPDETRTLVWSELSKMLGEAFEQPQTRDVSRGRRRISGHFTSSTEPPVVRDTLSETRRGLRATPRAEQRSDSRVRSDSVHSAPMRTILAPNGTAGASTAYNSDDEIVAEIIFHSQGRTARSRVNSPQAQTIKATPSHVSTTARTSLSQRTLSGQSNNNNHRSTSRQSTPRQDSSRIRSIQERRASFQDTVGVVGTYKVSAPWPTKTRTKSNDSCPTMDGASILTVASQKSSPATPPSRDFEPTTPKAMAFDPESGAILSPIVIPLTDGGTPYVDSLQRELINIGILSPKALSGKATK